MRNLLTSILILGCASTTFCTYGQTKSIMTSEFPAAYASQDASKLGDKDLKTKYYNSSKSIQWFQYEFKTPLAFNQYVISSANDMPARDPKSWLLKASDDGKKWIDLDHRSGEKFKDRETSNTYSFSNTKEYKYYRLYITESYSNSLQFSEWSLSVAK